MKKKNQETKALIKELKNKVNNIADLQSELFDLLLIKTLAEVEQIEKELTKHLEKEQSEKVKNNE